MKRLLLGLSVLVVGLVVGLSMQPAVIDVQAAKSNPHTEWVVTRGEWSECVISEAGANQTRINTFVCESKSGYKENECTLNDTKEEIESKSCNVPRAYCHATSSEVNPYNYLFNTAWVQHFLNNGTPQAGHELDFFTWEGDNECVGFTLVCTDPGAINYDDDLAPNEKSDQSVCEYRDTTPTVGPGEPTATPVPDPTATPKTEEKSSSGRWSALGYNATCEKSDIEVTFDTKREDGSREEKVKVTFEYQGNKKTAETNKDGRATVFYGKNGDGAVTAVADGYPSQSTHMIMPQDCPAVGGQVLGATTGQVLGATSYAATGNDAQTIFTVAQLMGMLLIATGAARYVKASLKA